jgi:hypothetical protein
MEIVSGYNRKCKDSVAGVRKVWLCKYQKYSRSQIITADNYLVSFPYTFIYSFASVEVVNASETQEQNEGGKFFNQSISLAFRSSEIAQIELLNTLEYRLLFLDNNGLYRIFGLYNGMESGGVTYETGSNKNSLNGFKVTFTGKEEKGSLFIDDLADTGFLESGRILLQDYDYFLLQNNDYLISQNG